MVADKFYDVIESDDDGDNDFRFNAIIQCVCVCVCVFVCVCVGGGGHLRQNSVSNWFGIETAEKVISLNLK